MIDFDLIVASGYCQLWMLEGVFEEDSMDDSFSGQPWQSSSDAVVVCAYEFHFDGEYVDPSLRQRSRSNTWIFWRFERAYAN